MVGTATIDNQLEAGGSGQDVHLHKTSLEFGLNGKITPIERVELNFNAKENGINMIIDDQLINVADIFVLDGTQVGNVQISITRTSETKGILVLEGTIYSGVFSIGGSEMWIDNVCFYLGTP